MADNSKDDIANALKAFSAGNTADGENQAEPASAPTPRAQPQPKVARQMSPIDDSEAPSAPASARPAPRPQPAAAVPSPKAPSQPPAAARVEVSEKQITFKRTIIPLLLTLGLILPAGGVVSIAMGDESPIGAELMLPIIMIVLGLLILGVAVITMLQVKDLLSSKAH